MAFGLGHPEGHRSVLPGQHRNRENIRLLISDNGSNITFAIVVGGLAKVGAVWSRASGKPRLHESSIKKMHAHTHTQLHLGIGS